MTLPALTDQTVLIALSVLVPGAILAGPKCWKRYKAKKAAREAKEAHRDEVLETVATTLAEISGDVKCLFAASASQLEALEVSLMALHGEHLNGSVEDALLKVRSQKAHLRKRLEDKIGDGLRGAD